jgi:hypothetical protein
MTTAGSAAEVDVPPPISSSRTTTAGPALEVDTALPRVAPTPPGSNLLLSGYVESPWQAEIEPGPFYAEVEA